MWNKNVTVFKHRILREEDLGAAEGFLLKSSAHLLKELLTEFTR